MYLQPSERTCMRRLVARSCRGNTSRFLSRLLWRSLAAARYPGNRLPINISQLQNISRIRPQCAIRDSLSSSFSTCVPTTESIFKTARQNTTGQRARIFIWLWRCLHVFRLTYLLTPVSLVIKAAVSLPQNCFKLSNRSVIRLTSRNHNNSEIQTMQRCRLFTKKTTLLLC